MEYTIANVCVLSAVPFSAVFSPMRRGHVCFYRCYFDSKWPWLRPSLCLPQSDKTSLSVSSLFLSFSCTHSLPPFLFYTWRFSPSHVLSFPRLFLFSLFVSMCPCLQCSPLLKARRLIQKTGSAWRCVVSVLLFFQLVFLGAAALCQPFSNSPSFWLYFRLPHAHTDNNLHISLSVSLFSLPMFLFRLPSG